MISQTRAVDETNSNGVVINYDCLAGSVFLAIG